MILFSAYFKVLRHSAKKNEKEIHYRGQKKWIANNSKASLAEKWMEHYLVINKLKQRIETIECDLHAKFTFYFPKTVYYTKKGVRSKNLPDLSNLYELPQDALQEVGIISDDTQICSHDGSRREPIDGSEYYIRIELFKFE